MQRGNRDPGQSTPGGVEQPARVFAAIDLGASSGRVVMGTVGDSNLIVEEVHRFPNRPISENGVLSWDIEQLFEDSMQGLRTVADRCEQLGGLFSGIGIDAWGVDFALLDDEGRIEGRVQHHRSAPDPTAAIARRNASPDRVYASSGVLDQAINTSFRLSELMHSARIQGGSLVFVPDLWVYLLTGRIGTEPTIASTSQLVDPQTRDWANELLSLYGIEQLRLPEVQPIGAVAALTSAEISRRIGAAQPIPVYRVAEHDTASAFAFAFPDGPGSADGLISSGTWSVVGVCVPEPLRTPEARELGFTNESGVNGTLLLRNLNGMWVLQECIRDWERVDGHGIDLDSLITEATSATPDPDHVFDMASPDLLGPDSMEERIRSLCGSAGRQIPRERADVVRAVLESLAVSYAKAVRAAERLTGRQLERVRIVGGGSKNSLLCQLTADATGLPTIAGPAESASIGNIAVQAASSESNYDLTSLYRQVTGSDTATRTFTPGNRSSLSLSVIQET
jgi:rhamnulokinase